MFFWGCKNKVDFKAIEDDKFEWTYNTRKINCLLIDLRKADLFSKGHYKNAINIPYSNNFIDDLDHHLSTRGNQNGAPMLFVYDENEGKTKTTIQGLKKQFEKQPSKFNIKQVRYKSTGFTAD